MKKDEEKATPVTEDVISCTSAENKASMEVTQKIPENGNDGNKRLKGALIRMAAALVAAVMLLTITGFAPLKLLRGPQEVEAIQNNEFGDFVCRDIFAILGFYADDTSKSGETSGRYAIVPMNGELVSVHFTQRYLDSASAVCDNTYALINGKAAALDKYVVVEGTVEEIGENASALMYDWFGTNKAQLVEMKMIADTDDNSEHLSDYLLVVDTVNSHSETMVYVTGIIAGMLLLYFMVEIILMAAGFYLPKKAKEQFCEHTESEREIKDRLSHEESSTDEDGTTVEITEENKEKSDITEDKE